MKKVFLTFVTVIVTMCGYAQTEVIEPEFVNSYCIMTGESTFDILPKENGEIQKHQNGIGKLAKIASGVSKVGMASGVLGVATSGSVGGVMNGLKVMNAASSIGDVARGADILAGAEGMDIVFNGGSSTYQVKGAGKEIKLLVKGENNEQDPMELYRIVRFKTSKKDRRVQWKQFEPALIGSKETEKAGYVKFTGHKYGAQSYMLTIPAEEVTKGEYGIFYLDIVTAISIPVGTFSVK